MKIKYLPTNLNEQALKFSTRFRSTLQTHPTTNHRSFFCCFPHFPPFHPSSSVSTSRDFKGEVLTNATRTARKTSKKFLPVANPGYGVYSIYGYRQSGVPIPYSWSISMTVHYKIIEHLYIYSIFICGIGIILTCLSQFLAQSRVISFLYRLTYIVSGRYPIITTTYFIVHLHIHNYKSVVLSF